MAEQLPPDPAVDDTTTTTQVASAPACPVCWATFQPTGRQRFCSDGCRKTAWARRHRRPTPAPEPVPAPGQRRASSVYACPDCDTRYHAQQWCHDCNRPCTRIGLGGPCPHCDQPVALNDLLPQQAPKPLP